MLSKEAKEYIYMLDKPEISRILTDRGLDKKEIKPLLKRQKNYTPC